MTDVVKIGRNAIYSAVSQAMLLVGAMISAVLITHYVGGEGYGIFSMMLIVSAFASVFLLGIPGAITKYTSEYIGKGEYEKINNIFNVALSTITLLGVLTGIVIIMSSSFLTDVFNISQERASDLNFGIKISGITIVFAAITGPFTALLRGLQKFDFIFKINIFVVSFQLMFLALIIWLDLGIKMVLLTWLAFTVVGFILNIAAFRFLDVPVKTRFYIDKKTLKKLLVFGFPLFMVDVSGVLHTRADSFIIGIFSSIQDVGYYNGALNIAQATLWLFPRFFLPPLMPLISELSSTGQSDRVRIACNRSIKYLLLINAPATVCMFILAKPVLDLLYPQEFLSAATALQILVIGYFFHSLTFPLTATLYGIGKPKEVTKNAISTVISILILHLILIPRYGMVGAAVGVTIPVTIFTFILLYQLSRAMNLTVKDFITLGHLKPIVASLLTGGFLYIAVAVTSSVNPFLFAFIAVLFYYVLIRHVFRYLSTEDTGLIKKILSIKSA